METFESQVVRAMLYLERYEPKALITIEKNLEIAQKNILEFIAKTQNQKQIRAFIKQELTKALGTFNDDILADIENVSELSWDKFGSIMASGFVTDAVAKEFKKFKAIDKSVKEKLLNPNRLILGNNIDDLKNQMIIGANNKLRSTILQGFQDGSGINAINQEVKTILGNLTRNQARTVTRTVLLNAIEEAKNESFSFFENEIDCWVYSAVADSRTSAYCLNANGYKTKDKSKAKFKPKTHYNCRSMWVIENELTRELDEEYKRKVISWERSQVNHRDGTKSTKFKVGAVKEVPRNATKETIFKAWSATEQQKFLGKTRYKLYKDGKMSLNDAISASTGKLIPLEELYKLIY